MKTSRRAFLDKIAGIGVISMVPALAHSQENNPTDTLKMLSQPYLQNLSSNGVTIMWTTSANCFSWVEYGAGNYTSKRAVAYENGLIQANNRVNKIRLPDLTPGKAHKYRVFSIAIIGYQGSKVLFGETVSSKMMSFTTPPLQEDEIGLVVLNDVHDRPQTIPQLLYRHGYTGSKPDFDFVVFNGDVFDWVSSEQQMIDHLIEPCTEIFASSIPFLLTQGNHECRGSFSRNITQYYDYPENRYYYAFDRGPIRFVVLDSGEDKTDDSVEYGGLSAFDRYREEQARWLEKEVASTAFQQAPFRVVLIHISPYHSGDWHGTLHCRKVFGPILAKAKIDLQLSGHTHRYAVHQADKDHPYPIIIGGGPLEGQRTLIKIQASKKTMEVKMIRDDDEVVGLLSISAKKA
ncbi:metallophosphoesterase family protein [Dyadobacter tibetensis]|uniref:metallophosphoesterase family protein n=1 Tax=Dyadobacter tibetensis TaxID=1211851 RepID=UPI0004705C5A|nr:metallophosphoesterase family protein [Dyadobacter tibetensis]